MTHKILTLAMLALLLFIAPVGAIEPQAEPTVITNVTILEETRTLAVACLGEKELRIFEAVAEVQVGYVDADGGFHLESVASAPHVGSATSDSEACAAQQSFARQPGVPFELGITVPPPIFPYFRIYDLSDQDTLLTTCVLNKQVKVATALATYEVGYIDTENERNPIQSVRNVPYVATSIMTKDCGS